MWSGIVATTLFYGGRGEQMQSQKFLHEIVDTLKLLRLTSAQSTMAGKI